jgi:hypothetical protein
MVEISDSLRLLFEASVEAIEERHIVSIPKELVEEASLVEDETYRIALLPTLDSPEPSGASPEANHQPAGSDGP